MWLVRFFTVFGTSGVRRLKFLACWLRNSPCEHCIDDGPGIFLLYISDSDESDSNKENMELSESNESSEEMDTLNSATPCTYREQFLHLVELLKSLNLLHFFADYAVADTIRTKVWP